MAQGAVGKPLLGPKVGAWPVGISLFLTATCLCCSMATENGPFGELRLFNSALTLNSTPLSSPLGQNCWDLVVLCGLTDS